MNTTTIETSYNQYIELRNSMYAWAYGIAQYAGKDKADNPNRPVVIMNDDQYATYQNYIERLVPMRDRLIDMGYDAKAPAMKLPEEVLTDVKRAIMSYRPAINSTLLPKERLIGVYDREIRQLTSVLGKKINPNAARSTAVAQHKDALLNATTEEQLQANQKVIEGQIKVLEAERQTLIEDDETHYRRRYDSGTDVRCQIHWPREQHRQSKQIQLTKVGIWVYDPEGRVQLEHDHSTARIDRNDSYEFNGVLPMTCRLASINGHLYKESVLEKMRKQKKMHRGTTA